MANWLRFLRSNTAGSIPTAAQVQQGQIAINTNDRMIYTKSSANIIVALTRTLQEIWTYILTQVLPVAAGGTGVTSLTSGGVLLGNGTGPIQSATPVTATYVIKAAVVNSALTWTQDYALTYWTEGLNQIAPNATVPVAYVLSKLSTATDIDAAVIPKGAGALLSQIPDATVTGGNKRGNYAVDHQRVRTGIAQVASGSASSILNGSNNTASGANSSVLNGISNLASGKMSTVINGTFASTKGIEGAIVFSNTGQTILQQQSGLYSMSIDTTGTTVGRLVTNKSVGGNATNQIVLNNNSTLIFIADIVGIDLASQQSIGIVLQGVVTRGASASTTAIVGSVSSNTIANNFPLLNPVTASAVVDTTNGAIGFNVTGMSGVNIRWGATIRATEVSK